MPLNDQILVYSTSNPANQYTPFSIIGATFNNTNRTITIPSVTSLTQLTSDISFLNILDGQVISYDANSTKWKNKTITLSSCNDVTITTPRSRDILSYNSTSSKWVNTQPNLLKFNRIFFLLTLQLLTLERIYIIIWI